MTLHSTRVYLLHGLHTASACGLDGAEVGIESCKARSAGGKCNCGDDPGTKSNSTPDSAFYTRMMEPDDGPSRASSSTGYENIGDSETLRTSAPPSRPAWAPGMYSRLPYLGLGALLGVFLLTGASVAILLASHNIPIDRWRVKDVKIQPQVWVAAFSTVANTMLGYAFAEGIVIWFWRRAGRGTTLYTLHDGFEAASFFPATSVLLRRRRLNPVALACIAVTISMARGPFFQRASSVSSRNRALAGTAELKIASMLPGFYFYDAVGEVHSPLDRMKPDVRRLIQNATIRQPIKLSAPTGCMGECEARVKASGFNVSCTEVSLPSIIDALTETQKKQPLSCKEVSPGDRHWANDSATAQCQYMSDAQASVPVFGIEYRKGPPSYTDRGEARYSAGINITTVFKDTPGCGGRVRKRHCALRQGTVEYAVRLTRDTIAILPPSPPSQLERRFVEMAPVGHVTFANDPDYWGKVFRMMFIPGRVDLVLNGKLRSTSFERFVNCEEGRVTNGASNVSCRVGRSWDQEVLWDHAVQYANVPDKHPKASSEIRNISSDVDAPIECRFTWRDPMQDLLDGMHEVAFRASVQAVVGHNVDLSNLSLTKTELDFLRASWTQTVPFRARERQTVYRTHWAYLSVAVVIGSVVGIAGVIPLYAGWWELGRNVSLNPLETAKAFGAPLLAGVNSNADRRLIVQQVGKRRVCYSCAVAAVGGRKCVGPQARGNGDSWLDIDLETSSCCGDDARSSLRLSIVDVDKEHQHILKPARGMTFE